MGNVLHAKVRLGRGRREGGEREARGRREERREGDERETRGRREGDERKVRETRRRREVWVKRGCQHSFSQEGRKEGRLERGLVAHVCGS